jgi:hypothetical protein
VRYNFSKSAFYIFNKPNPALHFMRILPFLSIVICITITSQVIKAQPSVLIGAGAELKFVDNGQIKSLDDNHRILFRRSEDIMEFRELGNLIFSPGANVGQQTAKMIMASNGNMGIGTTNPRGKLDIWGGTFHVTGSDLNGTLVAGTQTGNAWIGCDYLNNGISISPTGLVGIGTVSTAFKFDVNGSARAKEMDLNNGSADGARLVFRSQGNPEWRVRNFNGLAFFPGEGQPTSLWLDNSGSIGVGVQDTRGYKFAVNGSAIFTQVVVKTYPWPDYVFHSNYRLRPLSEVEQYINQYHHLPEVVSAEEVEKNGLNVGDNQAMLLKKIEELTLYVIEQSKEIKELRKEMEQVKKSKK